MRVQVRLYASLRAYLPPPAPGAPTVVDVPDGATVGDLLQKLFIPHDEVKVVFVNGRTRPPEWVLQDGDEVGVFPPVGGG